MPKLLFIRKHIQHYLLLTIVFSNFYITFGASFYGSSYIYLPLQEAKSKTNISFRFKTYQSDALLFLTAGPIDYCLVTLQSGKISVRINIGSGETVLSSKDLKLNDLNWHRVDIQRTDAELSLTIDGLHTSFFDIPGNFFELNIKYGIHVGGQGNFNELFLGKLNYYRGCMDQLFYNGIDVIESASKASGVHDVTFDCSNQFEATHLDAISFVVSGSFVVLPGFAGSARNGGTLHFDVKTSSSSAVLFYNSGSASHHSDFIAIEIISGKILLSINDGNGIVVLQSDVLIDDGFWHHIDIQFSPVYIDVSVDGKSRNLRPSLGDNKFFDLSEQLFIGGIEVNKQSLAYQQGLQSILSEGPESSLSGCLKNIVMNQKPVSLKDAQITKGVKSGECVWEYPCQIYENTPCIEGAECFQEGLNDFRCLCESSVCVKPNFTSHYKLTNAQHESHAFIDVDILKLKPLNIAEGGSDLITNDLITVLLDYHKYGITESGVLFHIIQSPQHGVLEVEIWDRTPASLASHYSHLPEISDNVFTLHDLITDKVRYSHDGSENYNDSIVFEIEFHSTFFHLPAFMHGKRHSFTFYIQIHPVNDSPKIISTASVLKLATNTKKTITADHLSVEDDDNSPSEIKYDIISIANGGQSFIENIKNPDTPSVSFTQNDINLKLIKFVHKTKTNEKDNKSVKVLLRIQDHHNETTETTLFIETFDFKLILVNNTGLVMPYNSFSIISPSNLSYTTNSEAELSQFIIYEIVKQSNLGSIQKLRGNGHWANVTTFSQRQINRNKIRFTHWREKPNSDTIDLQVSYADIKSPLISFTITFKTLQLRSSTSKQLSVSHDNTKILISNKELKFESHPFPVATNLIIYTILSLPRFGSLNLVIANNTQKLNIGSFITQKLIDERMFFYNYNVSLYAQYDSFDFEVATEGGLTNVEVSSFHFKFIPTSADSFIITNDKLIVIEGDKATINSKLFRVETADKTAFIAYNITDFPKFGALKLLNLQLNDVTQISPKMITQSQIDQNRLIYVHDDSENSEDNFDFAAFDKQNNFICRGTFVIEVIMKNDNAPIRAIDKAFHVCIDGEKRLTGDDLKYIDSDIDSTPSQIKYSKTYVPNGNLYYVNRPNVIAEQFTQQDLDSKNIIFKHNGDAIGRAILWITDGQFYASSILEIIASKPYLRILDNTGIIVKRAESALITINNLTVESNMDIIRKSDVTFKITSAPKYGTILSGDKETNRFSLQDLIDENIEYENKLLEDDTPVVEQDFFMFRIFLNGEDYLSSQVTNDNLIFNITIYPQSYFHLNVVNLKNITTDEDKFAIISDDHLLVKHSVFDAESIIYTITQLPKHGMLSLLSTNATAFPTPTHFISNKTLLNKNVKNKISLSFTQKDINDGLIYYMYLPIDTDLRDTSYSDCFKFDVSNGITTLPDLTVYLNIISKIITLTTANITVMEGHSVVLIEEDFTVSNPYYMDLIDEYLIIEEPKFGTIIFTNEKDIKMIVKSFTPFQLKNGFISYDHDGSETTTDWLTILVRANSLDKESLPTTTYILIDPINDETPHVVNNTGLVLWEGSTAIITNLHLASADDDSITDVIVYQISTPSNGYVTATNNRQLPIERFTQQQIDLGLIAFVHSGEMVGGFRFQVSDGTNIDSPHVFTITAKPVVITVLVNEKLHIFPGLQQSLTRDHLLVATNDGNNTREFTYHIVKNAKYGRFLLENADGSTKVVFAFTQKQIDQNFVLYEQNKAVNDVLVYDEILLDIESSLVQPIKGLQFTIEISVGNFANEVFNDISKYVVIKSLTVTEGKFATIKEENLNITRLVNNWQNKQYKGYTDKLYLKIHKNPSHGIVLYDGHNISNKTKSVPMNALKRKTLVYKHDDSNSLSDVILFGIYIRNGIDLMLLNQSLTVSIIQVNDELPVLLTQSPRINVIQGSQKLLTNDILNTRDDDGLPQNITYEFVPPINAFGYFTIDPNEKSVYKFSQLDVDLNRVYFKHNGGVGPQQFKFRIKDMDLNCSLNNDSNSVIVNTEHVVHCTPFYTLTVMVHQLTLKLYNHSTIHITQGTTKAKILPKHLATISNDGKAANIFYSVKEGPYHGFLIIDDFNNKQIFSQNDVNLLKVWYIQKNKTSTDYFIVDIFNKNNDYYEKSIHNITVAIGVKPLVRAKKPYLIASPGQKSIITQEYLDASELASLTNSIPKFIITSNPKFGYLRKYSNDKKFAKNITKRSLNEFTHEDIMNNLIVYIADNNLDLTYPNEIISDFVRYEISALSVAPALGKLVINIFNHKLITSTSSLLESYANKTNYFDTKNGFIELYPSNNAINYLNINITADQLLIAFVFIVVVISTVILIIIIRSCHSTVTNTETHNNKPPAIAQLSSASAILDTPQASDYGVEMIMMTNRLSPRSTPSVSEDMDNALLPLPPPTSPSLSTNCSILDTRSNTDTPYGYHISAVVDRLRGTAAEELQESSSCHILPLTAASLCMSSRSANSHTPTSHTSPTPNWSGSSVPMCKVTPIFPACLEDHYCGKYHQPIYPIHANADQPSSSLIEDVNSLVNSPLSLMRKIPYSAEDLYTPSSSSNNCNEVNTIQLCRNCMNYNNNCQFQNSRLYISENFNKESLGLATNCENCTQIYSKPKHQYWV